MNFNTLAVPGSNYPSGRDLTVNVAQYPGLKCGANTDSNAKVARGCGFN